MFVCRPLGRGGSKGREGTALRWPPNEFFCECNWTSGIKKLLILYSFYVKSHIFPVTGPTLKTPGTLYIRPQSGRGAGTAPVVRPVIPVDTPAIMSGRHFVGSCWPGPTSAKPRRLDACSLSTILVFPSRAFSAPIMTEQMSSRPITSDAAGRAGGWNDASSRWNGENARNVRDVRSHVAFRPVQLFVVVSQRRSRHPTDRRK